MDPSSAVLSLTYTREFGVADVDQWCYAANECVNTDPLVPLALVVVTGVVTFVVAATLLHVDRAWALLEEERERTEAERDAFEEFAERVAALDVTTARASIGTTGAVPALADADSTGRLERVTDAYRDTVMSVPHYEEEYDEPLEANMTAELGPDVAAAVVDGTAFSSHLQTALVAKSEEAKTKREELLGRLDGEANDLAEAESELADVADEVDEIDGTATPALRFDELLNAWDRLGTLESRCRSILAERQAAVHDRDPGSDDAPTIQEYLYRSLDVDYPVLAAGTALVERIDDARRDVEAALAGRH